MHDNRGVGLAFQALKWVPRFLLLTLCLIVIIYIFSVLISVEYDARGIRAESALALFVFSDVFSHAADPSAISLERFASSSFEQHYPLIEVDHVEDSEVVVRELRFAPMSARITLSSMDGSFDERVIFYEQDTFESLQELYIGRDRSRVRYARSENIVRVITDSEPVRTVLGRMTVEVFV